MKLRMRMFLKIILKHFNMNMNNVLGVWATLRVSPGPDPDILRLLLPHHYAAHVLLRNNLPLPETQNEEQVWI